MVEDEESAQGNLVRSTTRIMDRSQDFMVGWQDGSYRLDEGQNNAWRLIESTQRQLREARAAASGNNTLVRNIRAVMARMNEYLELPRTDTGEIDQTADRYNFDDWSRNMNVLREAQTTLRAAFNLIRQSGIDFELKGFEIRVPYQRGDYARRYGNLFERLLYYSVTGTRRMDVFSGEVGVGPDDVSARTLLNESQQQAPVRAIITNNGAVVPVGAGSAYVVDPETGAVYKRPLLNSIKRLLSQEREMKMARCKNTSWTHSRESESSRKSTMVPTCMWQSWLGQT